LALALTAIKTIKKTAIEKRINKCASMGDAGYPPIPPDSGFSGGGGTDWAKLTTLNKRNRKICTFFDNFELIICLCF